MFSFKKLFSETKTSDIGLSINSGHAVAVQLDGKPSADTFDVRAWSHKQFAGDVIEEGIIKDKDVLIKVLRELFNEPDFGSFEERPLIFAAPEHQCYHTSFIEEKSVGDSPYSIAYQNTTAHIPFAADNMFWDWNIVGQDETRNCFYSVVVPRPVLMPYRAVFATCGFEANVIEPEITSSIRFFTKRRTYSEPTIMVNIGREDISVSTIDEFGIHQSSLIEGEGIDQWATRLSALLNVRPQAAEKALFQIGLRDVEHPKAKQIRELLSSAVRKLVEEVAEHFYLYRQREHQKPEGPTRVQFVGEGVIIKELVKNASKELEMSPVSLDSAVTFDPSFSVERRALFHSAIGAAMRGLSPSGKPFGGPNVLKHRMGKGQRK